MVGGETYYLGLGANLGDRRANLALALARLAASGAVRVVRCSSLYETAPVGPAQPDFLNAAAQVESALAPLALLALCKEVERELGRAPDGPRWGPRPLDLDLLLAGPGVGVLSLPELQLPHLLMHERAFALVPLAEIAPQALHPVLGKSVASLLADLAARDPAALAGVRRLG